MPIHVDKKTRLHLHESLIIRYTLYLVQHMCSISARIAPQTKGSPAGAGLPRAPRARGEQSWSPRPSAETEPPNT